MSTRDLCPFFNQTGGGFLCLFVCLFVCFVLFVCWIWSFMASLYILDVNPLLGISVVNIFSPSVGCLFVLLMVSCAVQKFFSLT